MAGSMTQGKSLAHLLLKTEREEGREGGREGVRDGGREGGSQSARVSQGGHLRTWDHYKSKSPLAAHLALS